MGNPPTANRIFMVKAGMTPQDVINSKKATAQQKKMAYVFDSDGVAGYSQREADVFNATLITDRGQNGVSLWTRYKDGSKKETKYNGDIAAFKFAPKGDVKPYLVAKGKQPKSTMTQQTSVPTKATTLPPLTQVQIGDTLTFYSKKDSINYNKKDDAAYDKFARADNAAYDKFARVDNAAYDKFERADNAAYAKFEKQQITLEEWQSTKNNAFNEWQSTKNNAFNEWQSTKNNAYNEWMSTRSMARQEHCSQVRKYQPKN